MSALSSARANPVHRCRRLCGRSIPAGFTLLEILIVVIIISIVTVAGVQLLGLGSARSELKQYGERLSAQLRLACEQAVLQNRNYGMALAQNTYLLMQRQGIEWVAVENSPTLNPLQVRVVISIELQQQGNPVRLPAEVPETPQLRCATDGSLTAFVLNLNSGEYSYQLRTESPWEMRGGWDE